MPPYLFFLIASVRYDAYEALVTRLLYAHFTSLSWLPLRFVGGVSGQTASAFRSARQSLSPLVPACSTSRATGGSSSVLALCPRFCSSPSCISCRSRLVFLSFVAR